MIINPYRFAAAGNPYGDDLVFEVTTTSTDEVFKITCINNGTYDAEIDWGDESSSTITSYDDADLSHTYASAGAHIVTVPGTDSLGNISFKSATDSSELLVTKILNLGLANGESEGSWDGCVNAVMAANATGALGGNNAYLAFSHCESLGYFPSTITFSSAITLLNNAFEYVEFIGNPQVSLTGSVLCQYTFQYASFTSDSGISIPNPTKLKGAFRYNTELEEVTQVWGNSGTSDYNSMFYGCTALEDVGANLFDDIPAGAVLTNMFGNCALSATSVKNILESFVASGRSGLSTSLAGGTSAAPIGDGLTAYNTLVADSWTIPTN